MTFNVIAEKEEIGLIPKDNNYPTIITGVGAINIMEALNHLPKDTRLINYGFVGSPDIPIGTVVRARSCELYHPTVHYPERGYSNITPTHESRMGYTNTEFVTMPCAKCYTSTDFQESITEPLCVYDMELAFIMALGFNKVWSFKTVSDRCDYHEYKNNINRIIEENNGKRHD